MNLILKAFLLGVGRFNSTVVGDTQAINFGKKQKCLICTASTFLHVGFFLSSLPGHLGTMQSRTKTSRNKTN